MIFKRKNRTAFRPTVADASLEERVVLSTTASHQIMAFANAPTGNLTVQQLRNAFVNQTHSALQSLNQSIRQDVKLLYANGKPTAQQLSDFNATVGGMINATAFRLASQQALLPSGGTRNLNGFQNALLSNNSNSLLSQLQSLTTGRVPNTSQAFQNMITNRLASLNSSANTQLANYFNHTNIAQASVDSNGNQIPLQQFIAQRIVNQYGSTLSGLSQGFMNAANSTLFANGATNPSQSDLQGFQRQFGSGLNLAAFQLGNNLNLLNGASSSLLPQLQSGIFGSTNTGTGTGTGSFNGLFPALQGLPFNDPTANFSMGLNNAFNNGFSNVSSSIGSFLNLPQQANTGLPSFNSVLSPTFTNSNFFGGFNSGYGSGFQDSGPPRQA